MVEGRALSPPRPVLPWPIPRAWDGERVFVLGGGPSLKGFDASVLRGRGRVIGINEAGLTMAPWCDVLHWCDAQWLEWNIDRIGLHQGQHRICRHSQTPPSPKCPKGVAPRLPGAWADYEIKRIERNGNAPISIDPTKTSGVCSGASSINMAFLFGAASVVLLGFDMTDDGQWHDKHKDKPKAGHCKQMKIPSIEKMARALVNHRLEVLNATPGSALTCFPMVDLEEVL